MAHWGHFNYLVCCRTRAPDIALDITTNVTPYIDPDVNLSVSTLFFFFSTVGISLFVNSNHFNGPLKSSVLDYLS